MKAAVIQKFGDIPQYQDFPYPITGVGDVVIQVKAVVLENFDKMTAAQHDKAPAGRDVHSWFLRIGLSNVRFG